MRTLTFLFSALACVSLHAQVFENTLLDYDFDGFFPEELTISYAGNGNPAFDSTLYVWRSVQFIESTFEDCSLNNNGLLIGGTYEVFGDWQNDGINYGTYINFPVVSTLDFDSLNLSFDLINKPIGDNYALTIELSSDGGENWYTAFQIEGSIGNQNLTICESENLSFDISAFTAESLSLRLHHEGWRFSAIDNFLLMGYSASDTNIGCTQLLACNYNELAIVDDGSCLFEGYACDDNDPVTINDQIQFDCLCAGSVIEGCTQLLACNYNELATAEDGSCLFEGHTCDDNNPVTINDQIQPDCLCAGVIIAGCSYALACNYNPDTSLDDGSCVFIGDSCDDGDSETENDVIDDECDCMGMPITSVGNLEGYSVMIYPNPCSDNLSVDFGMLEGLVVRVRIFDLKGRLFFDQSRSTSLSIRTSEFAKGLYLLSLSTPDVEFKKHVVIE